MTVEIRKATTTDAQQIVALVESAYRGDSSREGWTTEADLLDGQRTDLPAVEDALRDPDVMMLVAVDDTLVGCCQITKRSQERAYFGTFAVRPGLQGAGLGRQLLEAAERRARTDWGCTCMEMQVIAQRDELIAWYVRRGYEATGETRPFPYGEIRAGSPKRDDLAFVVLVKPLTD